MKTLFVYISLFFLIAPAWAQDEDINDKLVTAAAKGELSKVQSLHKKGADINAKNKARWTALAYACKYGNDDIVKYLLVNKVDVNGKVNTGSTPLYIALNAGFYDIADMLTMSKADVNIPDIMGMSPLAWAAKDANMKMVKYLLDKGANVNAVNSNSRSIMDICTDFQIKELLKSKGAKTTQEMVKDSQ